MGLVAVGAGVAGVGLATTGWPRFATLYADSSSSYTLTDNDMDDMYAEPEMPPSTANTHTTQKTLGDMKVRLFATSEETLDGLEVVSFGSVVDHRDNTSIIVSSPIASATLTYPLPPGQAPSSAATSTFATITVTNPHPSSKQNTPASKTKRLPSDSDLSNVHSVLMTAFLSHYVQFVSEATARLAYGDAFDSPPPPDGMSPLTYPDPQEQLDLAAAPPSLSSPPGASDPSQPPFSNLPEPIYTPGAPLPDLGLEGFHDCLMNTVVAIDHQLPGAVDPDVCAIGVATFYHPTRAVCLGFNGAGDGAVRAVVGRRKSLMSDEDKGGMAEPTTVEEPGGASPSPSYSTSSTDPDYIFELFDGEPPKDTLRPDSDSPDVDGDEVFDPTRPFITTCTPDPFAPRIPNHPSTTTTTRDSSDFVVLASAKVWEVMNWEEVGQMVADVNRRRWRRVRNGKGRSKEGVRSMGVDIRDDDENPAWVVTNEVIARDKKRRGGHAVDNAFAIQIIMLE